MCNESTNKRGTCNEYVEHPCGERLDHSICCGGCDYYEILNEGFAEDGTSDGYCNHTSISLSQARIRTRIITQSDYGTKCNVWEPNTAVNRLGYDA